MLTGAGADIWWWLTSLMSVCRNVILGLETDTSSNISDIVMWAQSLNPVIVRPGAWYRARGCQLMSYYPSWSNQWHFAFLGNWIYLLCCEDGLESWRVQFLLLLDSLLSAWAINVFLVATEREERDGHLMMIKLGMRQIFCQRQGTLWPNWLSVGPIEPGAVSPTSSTSLLGNICQNINLKS